MASIFHWFRKAADHADLLEEILPGQTVVEVIGEGRVLIEGHHGVSEYNDDEISAKVDYGVVKIYGCNLKLSQMDGNKLVISGIVKSIRLVRRTEE